MTEVFFNPGSHFRKRLLLTALCFFLIGASVGTSQELVKVPFPYGPIGLNSLPWVVAKEARLFEKNGLDVDMVFIGASSVMVQSMLAGSANIAGLAGPAIITNVLKGGDIIQVAAMVPYFTQSLMVHPEIKDIRALKGKKVGVSRFGSVTDFALRALLERYDVKGVNILQMGGLAEAMAGLSKGSVDGAVVSPPHPYRLIREGFHELVSPKDLQKLGIGFLTQGICARRSFVANHRDIVVRMIKATMEGVKYISVNEAFAKRLISKYLRIVDPELLSQSYLYVADIFAKEPFVPPSAIQSMTQRMAQMNLVDARAAQGTLPSAFFDNSAVEELKQSGFFEHLWK